MGCFDKTTKSFSTTSTATPKSIQALESSLAPAAVDLAKTPYESYEGERVAGFNGDQTQGFDMLRDLVGNQQDVTGEAVNGIQSYMGGPAQNVGTERVVDEGGKLGAISDYMNPYQQNVIDPAIQKIMDATFDRKKQLDGIQHNAGAFGDARHGIQEGQLFNDAQETIGNVSGQLLNTGYNQAMGLRQGDQQQNLNADVTNANFNEGQLSRQFQGAAALPGIQASGFSSNMDQINALMGMGQQQQSNTQSGLDVGYEDFLRSQEHPYRGIDTLIGAMNGIPTARETTTTKTEPNNSNAGFLGSLLGGIF